MIQLEMGCGLSAHWNPQKTLGTLEFGITKGAPYRLCSEVEVGVLGWAHQTFGLDCPVCVAVGRPRWTAAWPNAPDTAAPLTLARWATRTPIQTRSQLLQSPRRRNESSSLQVSSLTHFWHCNFCSCWGSRDLLTVLTYSTLITLTPR